MVNKVTIIDHLPGEIKKKSEPYFPDNPCKVPFAIKKERNRKKKVLANISKRRNRKE